MIPGNVHRINSERSSNTEATNSSTLDRVAGASHTVQQAVWLHLAHIRLALHAHGQGHQEEKAKHVALQIEDRVTYGSHLDSLWVATLYFSNVIVLEPSLCV
jgi:hypothetical protein